TIIFRHLTKEDLKKVIDFELSKVRQRLLERGYGLELTEEAKEFLIEKGANLDYGARPLRRALEQRIEDPLAEELLRGAFEGVNTIVVDAIKNDEGQTVRLGFRGENRQREESPKLAVAGSEEA
ncbi:MAG: NDP-hexose 4-ketoreductase, partial [Planctomycetota bacterium]